MAHGVPRVQWPLSGVGQLRAVAGDGGKEWLQLSTFPPNSVFYILKKVWADANHEDNRRSSGSACSMCDGSTRSLGFKEGFCEVTSMLGPGW